MLTRLRIENYKALRAVEISLTPIHAIIGPNDSGKTSILEALYALASSAEKGIDAWFPGIWEGADLVWQRNPATSVVFEATIVTESETVTYTLSMKFGMESRRVALESERLTSGQRILFGKSNPNQTRPRATAEGDKAGLGEDAYRHAGELRDAIRGVHMYRWDPRFLRLPAATDSNWRFKMEPTGFGLVRCLEDILGDDRSRFTELEQRFRKLFPEFKSIKFVTQPAFRTRETFARDVPSLQNVEGKGLAFQLQEGEALLPASQVSDGVLLVLAYLAILYLPEPPRFLLIEEPENGIHPKRLQEVIRILRSLVEEQDRTQVIMTTHSPYLIDEMQPEEVTLCSKRDDGSVQTHRLSTIPAVKKQLDLFTLGEIWSAEGDEELARQPADGTKGGD